MPVSERSVADRVAVGRERLGLPTLSHRSPPREQVVDVHPERIILGPGEDIFEGIADALTDTMATACRQLPRALASHPVAECRAMLGTL